MKEETKAAEKAAEKAAAEEAKLEEEQEVRQKAEQAAKEASNKKIEAAKAAAEKAAKAAAKAATEQETKAAAKAAAEAAAKEKKLEEEQEVRQKANQAAKEASDKKIEAAAAIKAAKEKEARALAADERKSKAEALKASESREKEAFEKEVRMKKEQAELKIKADEAAAQKKQAEIKEKALALESLKKEAQVKQAAEKVQKAQEQMAAELQKAADEAAREKSDKAKVVADEQKQKQKEAHLKTLKAQNQQALALETTELTKLENSMNTSGLPSDEHMQAEELAFASPKPAEEDEAKQKSTAETQEETAERALEAGEAQVEEDLAEKRKLAHGLESSSTQQAEYSAQVQQVLDDSREGDEVESKADQKIAAKEEEIKVMREKIAALRALDERGDSPAMEKSSPEQAVAKELLSAREQKNPEMRNVEEKLAEMQQELDLAKGNKQQVLVQHDTEEGKLNQMLQKEAALEGKIDTEAKMLKTENQRGRLDSFKLQEERNDAQDGRQQKFRSLQEGAEDAGRKLKDTIQAEHTLQTDCDGQRQLKEQKTIQLAEARIHLELVTSKRLLADQRVKQVDAQVEQRQQQLSGAIQIFSPFDTNLDLKKELSRVQARGLVKQVAERRAKATEQQALASGVHQQLRYEVSKVNSKVQQCNQKMISQVVDRIDAQKQAEKEQQKFVTESEQVLANEQQTDGTRGDELTEELGMVEKLTEMDGQSMRKENQDAMDVRRSADQIKNTARDLMNCRRVLKELRFRVRAAEHGVLRAEKGVAKTKSKLDTVRLKRFKKFLKTKQKAFETKDAVCNGIKQKGGSEAATMDKLQERTDAATAATAKWKVALQEEEARLKSDNVQQSADTAAVQAKDEQSKQVRAVEVESRQAETAAASQVLAVKSDSLKVHPIALPQLHCSNCTAQQSVCLTDLLQVREADKKVQRAEDQFQIANEELARTGRAESKLDKELQKAKITTAQLKRQLRLNVEMEPLKSAIPELRTAADVASRHYDAIQRQASITEQQLHEAERTEAAAAAQAMVSNATLIPTDLIAHVLSRNCAAGKYTLYLEAGTRSAFKAAQFCVVGEGPNAEVVEIASFGDAELLGESLHSTTAREETVLLKHPIKNSHLKGEALWQSDKGNRTITHFYVPLAEQAEDEREQAAVQLINATAAARVTRAIRENLQQLFGSQRIEAAEAKRQLKVAYNRAYYTAAVGETNISNIPQEPHLEQMLHSAIEKKQKSLKQVRALY